MIFNFANGTEEQKSLWTEAIHHLLHLPFDLIPLTIDISFVDPSELIGEGHTDLAQTTWSYGSNLATTIVRNDAPGFASADAGLEALAAGMGLDYSATQHFHETAVHETAHALYASLPEEARVAVAQMFGAQGDDPAELAPEGSNWEDRIIEAIADTFKEAFLPRRFRVFPNRTNLHIPYARYPEFRKHFRTLQKAGGGEEVAPTWFRAPRADALHLGAKGGFPVGLPTDPPEKGDFGSGVYFSFGEVFNEFGEEWSEGDGPKFAKEYDGGAAAQWMGLLEDSIEARDPVVVPPETFFSSFAPWLATEEYSYVGDALFEIINPEFPPPWFGGSLGRFWLHIGIQVQDEDGDSYEINWLINVQFSAWTNVETEEKIWGYAPEGIKYFRKNGATIAEVTFSTGPGAIFNDYAMSGEDIFKAFEGQGESPQYEPGAVLSFRTGTENFVVYEFPFPENHPLEDLRDYAWGHMHSMWVAPLTNEPGEGEGEKIPIEVPDPSLTPTGSAQGAKPSSRPVAGNLGTM